MWRTMTPERAIQRLHTSFIIVTFLTFCLQRWTDHILRSKGQRSRSQPDHSHLSDGGTPINGVPSAISHAQFFCVAVIFYVYCIFSVGCCESGCQYKCNQLPEETRLRNDLLCVKWNVNLYSIYPLTYLLTYLLTVPLVGGLAVGFDQRS